MDEQGISIGIGSAISDMVVAKQNQNAQKHQNQLDYERGMKRDWKYREWALEDWNNTNRYNSPVEQKKRLEEAGLNSRLMYNGGSGITTAGMVRGGEGGQQNQQAAKFDFNPSNTMANVMRTFQIMAETQNLEKQKDLIVAQTDESKQRTKNLGVDYQIKDVDYYVKSKSKDFKVQSNQYATDNAYFKVEKQKADIENTRMQTQFLRDKNSREQLKNSADVSLTYQKLITEKLEQELKRTTNRVQQQAIQEKIEKVKSAQFYQELIKIEAGLKRTELNQKSDDFFNSFERIMGSIPMMPYLFPIKKF